MFHEGDLQSGIALAVQSQKAVLCFIHDDNETSGTWLDLLTHCWDSQDAERRMVALKLRAGSQEAGFLSPICSINSTPAIIVIKDANVQASLQAHNVTTEQLQDRLFEAFGPKDQSQLAEATHDGVSTAAEVESREGTEQEATSSEPSGLKLGYLDLPASEGRFRLPKNAYDALRSHTDALVDSNEPPEQILASQLGLLERLPIFRDEVRRIRAQGSPTISDSTRDRLLRLPASAINAQARPPGAPSNTGSGSAGQQVYAQQPTAQPASTTSPPPNAASSQPPQAQPPAYREPQATEPPNYSSSQHQAQRSDYIRLQKEREQKQRDERERIKAQIKADREERRRQEEIRKMNDAAGNTSATSDSPETAATTTTNAKKNDVRIQVRTFDGSTLRTILPSASTINENVRPWIDASADNTVPYNLKLILTPLPNKNIEASEEEFPLSDLGIKGSCTMVMVPVKGYVESYTGTTPTGLIGSAVSGGYGLISGTAGAVIGGVKTFLGIGGAAPQGQQGQTQTADAPSGTAGSGGQTVGAQSQRNMRVRTLADQRVADSEERRGDQQFYNGNALNFAPNRGDDDDAQEKKKD